MREEEIIKSLWRTYEDLEDEDSLTSQGNQDTLASTIFEVKRKFKELKERKNNHD